MFFAEPEYHEAGKRVFDVSINQTKVLSNVDLYKEAGYCTGYSKKYLINVKENEGLTIKFEALKGKAIINGLQIVKTN
jgi:beta-galactosidase